MAKTSSKSYWDRVEVSTTRTAQEIYDLIGPDGITKTALQDRYWRGETSYLGGKTGLLRAALGTLHEQKRAYFCPIRRRIFRGQDTTVAPMVERWKRELTEVDEPSKEWYWQKAIEAREVFPTITLHGVRKLLMEAGCAICPTQLNLTLSKFGLVLSQPTQGDKA